MFVKLYLQYRDGSNYKTPGEMLLTNNDNLSLDTIKAALTFEEPIVAEDYGLRNIAPMDNEFLPCNGDDHSFIEIVDADFTADSGGHAEGDIATIVNAFNNGGVADQAEREQRRQTEAKNAYQSMAKLLNLTKCGNNVN